MNNMECKYTFYEEKEYVARIHSKYNMMNDNEKKIADYILEKPQECLEKTIREISNETGISTASIVRFSRVLGYSGFSDLKFHMQQNILTLDSSNLVLRFTDTSSELKQKVVSLASSSMMESVMKTDDGNIEKAISMISNCERVYLFGCGTASGVVNVALSMFLSMGIPAYSVGDSVLQMKTVSYMTEKDLIICVDYSGYLKDIADILGRARNQNVPSILITGSTGTLNESLASVTLYTATRNEKNALNFAITALNEMAILLVIQTGVFLRIEQREQYTETAIKQYDPSVKELSKKPVKQ